MTYIQVRSYSQLQTYITEQHPKYMCWHCHEKCDEFGAVIKYGENIHCNESHMIRTLSLNPETGKSSYATKDFQITKEAKEGNILIPQDNDRGVSNKSCRRGCHFVTKQRT